MGQMLLRTQKSGIEQIITAHFLSNAFQCCIHQWVFIGKCHQALFQKTNKIQFYRIRKNLIQKWKPRQTTTELNSKSAFTQGGSLCKPSHVLLPWAKCWSLITIFAFVTKLAAGWNSCHQIARLGHTQPGVKVLWAFRFCRHAPTHPPTIYQKQQRNILIWIYPIFNCFFSSDRSSLCDDDLS